MPRPPGSTSAGVSSREAEVLALIGEHMTNAEIAARLSISIRTVESHVSSLLRKLGEPDRRALAAHAASAVARTTDTAGMVAPALPSPLTTFVGRESERRALAETLGAHRLVTAVGPGGVGKTRLALAVAADLTPEFTDGAWYVDLAPVTHPAMVPQAVAAALGLGEQPRRSVTDTVVGGLVDRESLLILDNCEHLVDGVVVLAERLLRECSGLTVLATSRARLMVPFEWEFKVPGLSLPDGNTDGDAVALFMARAAAVGVPALGTEQRARVREICRELEGVALAVELAASRLPTLGLDGLQEGLADPLRLLTGGPRVDERHRSLRATLDWSWGLLYPADQALLRRVSVFTTPFDAAAAAAIANFPPVEAESMAHQLAVLAEQSLLVAVPGVDGTRYRALEAIRQYGADQLEAARETYEVKKRHLEWCLKAAVVIGHDSAVPGGPQRAAFDGVADELRSALGWASDQPGHRADAHRLALALARLTFARGLPTEAQERYESAARLAGADADAAAALQLAAGTAKCRMVGDDAVRLYRAAADAARCAGDDAGAALNLARAVETVRRFPGIMAELPPAGEEERMLSEARARAGSDQHAQAAILIAETGSIIGDLRDPLTAEMTARAVELARRVGDPVLQSAALDMHTFVQLKQGDLVGATTSPRRRLELLSALPLRPEVGFEISDALHMAPMTSIGAGDLPNARRFAQGRPELPFYREEHHLLADWVIVWDALVGDFGEAIELSDRLLEGWERAGRQPLGGFAHAPAAAAMVHGLCGDDDRRAEWTGILTEFRRGIAHLVDPRDTGYIPTFNALLFLHRGQAEQALAELDAEPESFRPFHAVVWSQWYAGLWAESAVLANHPDAGGRIERARFLAVGNPVANAIVTRADALLTGNRDSLLDAAAALEAAGCRYQWARALVLAGGDEAALGEAALKDMGAEPMTSPE